MMTRVVAFVLLLTAFLTACTATGTPESGVDETGDVTAITLVTPEGNDSYPAPAGEGGYPVAPVAAVLPTGYPELTVIAPSGQIDPNELTPVSPGTEPQVMPSPGRPNVTASSQLSLLIEAITEDLSAYTGTSAEDIRYISGVPMVWPNGGLGCPAEGMAYIEVQVEGLLVTMEAAGESFTYHTDGMNRYVLCQDAQPVSSGSVVGR